MHGWEEIAEQLSGHAARQEWGEMGALISDAILRTFAVVADPVNLPAALIERYGKIADHLALYTPFVPGERDDFWRRLITELKA